MGDFQSRQIGVFTGSMVNLAVAALFIRWIRPARIADVLIVGITWLALTLTFEVAFARAVMQASWQRIGSDYDLIHGGLLPIGLLIVAPDSVNHSQSAPSVVRRRNQTSST